MKFILRGNKICCCRKDLSGDKPAWDTIVEFDSHLDVIPPHVESTLSTDEQNALKTFLVEKEIIRSHPEYKIILQALPLYIDQATNVLETMHEIDEVLYTRITKAMDKLGRILADIDTVESQDGVSAGEVEIDNVELLKQQLVLIGQYL